MGSCIRKKAKPAQNAGDQSCANDGYSLENITRRDTKADRTIMEMAQLCQLNEGMFPSIPDDKENNQLNECQLLLAKATIYYRSGFCSFSRIKEDSEKMTI